MAKPKKVVVNAALYKSLNELSASIKSRTVAIIEESRKTHGNSIVEIDENHKSAREYAAQIRAVNTQINTTQKVITSYSKSFHWHNKEIRKLNKSFDNQKAKTIPLYTFSKLDGEFAIYPDRDPEFVKMNSANYRTTTNGLVNNSTALKERLEKKQEQLKALQERLAELKASKKEAEDNIYESWIDYTTSEGEIELQDKLMSFTQRKDRVLYRRFKSSRPIVKSKFYKPAGEYFVTVEKK